MDLKPYALIAALTVVLPLVSCIEDYEGKPIPYQKNVYDLNNEFKVIYWPDRVRVVIPINELFVEQNYKYKTAGDQHLNRLIKLINEQDQKVFVTVRVFSDSIRSVDFSKQLTTKQAEVIAQHLWGLGVGRDQISFEGCGSEHPVASHQTTDGNARNRRVEIDLMDFNQADERQCSG